MTQLSQENSLINLEKEYILNKLIDDESNESNNEFEFESDSSIDSDGDLIRTGDIPHNEWYSKELHDGYDIDAKKVFKRNNNDNIDNFLLNQNKNQLKRRIYDMKNDRISLLNDRDLAIISRIRSGKCATKMYQQEIPNSYIFDITTSGIKPKTSFIINKLKYKQILKYVNNIHKNQIKINKYGQIKQSKKSKIFNEKMRMDPYRTRRVLLHNNNTHNDIWKQKIKTKRKRKQIIRAPKVRLPTNYESYNPSDEYLFNNYQKNQLLNMNDINKNGRIIPIKYNKLLHVPQYNHYINNIFNRCLDLYLLPRKISKKTIINPKYLLPSLPDINNLKPFPEILSQEYISNNIITSIDITSDGIWLACGDKNGNISIYEIDSGRLYYKYSFGNNNSIKYLQFNPIQNKQSLLSICVAHRCILIPLLFVSSFHDYNKYIIEPIKKFKKFQKFDDKSNKSFIIIPQLNLKETLSLFNQNIFNELSHWPQLINKMCNEMNWNISDKFKDIANEITKYNNNNNNKDKKDKKDFIELNTNDISIAARWSFLTCHSGNVSLINSSLINNNIICISHLNYLNGIKWHAGGNYFATYRSELESSSLIIHRFDKFQSQIPFTKSIGSIQDIIWHPRKPLIYIACKNIIRCFNLSKCKLQESYNITTSWITSFDLHLSGLNMIVGGMDGKISWYDIDLSYSPYKTFNYHNNNICRKVTYHNYNKFNHLWATCGDDGKIFIFYCKMFRNKYIDPILIPLKIIKLKNGHRFLDCKFHPKQPWIFGACSDGVTRLYTAT